MNKVKKYCPHGCLPKVPKTWSHCPYCGCRLDTRVLPAVGEIILAESNVRGMLPSDDRFRCEVLEVNPTNGSIFVNEIGMVEFYKVIDQPPKRRWLSWWYDMAGNLHGVKGKMTTMEIY